jgi:phytoene synthase
MPGEILERHNVTPQQIFAGQTSAGLNAAFGELRDLARQKLAALGEHISALPREALPAFLPLAPLRAALDRLERSDAFTPSELSAWRRQWLIWRASRKPVNIAG